MYFNFFVFFSLTCLRSIGLSRIRKNGKKYSDLPVFTLHRSWFPFACIWFARSIVYGPALACQKKYVTSQSQLYSVKLVSIKFLFAWTIVRQILPTLVSHNTIFYFTCKYNGGVEYGGIGQHWSDCCTFVHWMRTEWSLNTCFE